MVRVGPVEGAESAVGVAHVRVVQVGVDDERDTPLGVVAVPPLLGQRSEVQHVRLGEKEQGFFLIDTLAGGDLASDC